ncbi:Fe-S oxidoreductase [Rubrobacter radiotolerans]|uniref:Fe-S oxidoreductase n=1 Tax=Rubrobacter radiotolerans TaxID=42256 RepID=A0A023X688_RUBRA|nr:heterodisulfide reductase-related iron-sulfur binding cluster [Rubrobacter radiotolerans]AHY47544.1 Fe-S oxidoreductase [Rubrobacter radiotolerans]MDX5894947.1 heterodisulfide reductase-related iron-sulfur binding cluster [Rubrobacter radiotolerans]SMC07132.1 glycolate oxidase iron-sulfur subunit [Rubrobacter radiotolerans DSM 5868]
MSDATNGGTPSGTPSGSPHGRNADDIFETVRQAYVEEVGESGTKIAVENPEPKSGPRGKAPFPAFDSHHPPEKDLISDCVHCGFCLPACPTYVLFGEEMDSPRGRIYLMNKGLTEEPMNDKMVAHFDNCLGCMACVTACPSGVQYDKLIEATRAQVERRHERSPDDKAFREMIFQLFPYPSRLRAAAAPMRLYKKFGVGEKLRRSGIMGLLPKRLQAMEALLPDLPEEEKIPEVTPPRGEKRYRVGILTGCVQRVFFSRVNAATVRVLAAEGCEVVAPEGQGCCGALSTHAGREEESLRFAKSTIDTFENLDLDYVVINAAGCGSTMKEYGYILRDEPEYAERAERFSASVRDISEFLQEVGTVAERHPLPMTVAYHDACHLSHAQGIKAQPRKTLKEIPGLEVKEIKEGDICCGSAGIYNMVQPESASMLGERKAKNVAATGASMLVTSNPGCTLQIQGSLKKLGHGMMPARHPMEVLDASIRGESVESLFARE